MGKKFLIAANWKANSPPTGFDAVDSPFRPRAETGVIVFPMAIDIHRAIEAGLSTGAQSGSQKLTRPQTGDITMATLKEHGCTHVLCGHSERRLNHHESIDNVLAQVHAAIGAGLQPVICVGETEPERAAGKEEEIVRAQLRDVPDGVIVAYEPVWAIGNGRSATPEDAQKMHAFIRSILPKKDTMILYGGSMNGKNCESLLSQPDIDGGLIGAASLKPDDFRMIVETAAKLSK